MPDESVSTSQSEALSSSDVRELAESLKAQFASRNGEFSVLRERYRGTHWGDSINPLPADRYSLTVNYIGKIVDKTVQSLVGRGMAIQCMSLGVDEEARRVAEDRESLLYWTWRQNQSPKVFTRVAFNQSLLRIGLIYYWWDPSSKLFKFKSIAPDNYYPVYDGEDVVECVIISRRNTRSLKRAYPALASQIYSDTDYTGVSDNSSFARVSGGLMDAIGDEGGSSTSHNGPLVGYTTVIDWYDKYDNWVRLMGDAVYTHKLGYEVNRVPVIEFPANMPGDEQDPRSDIQDIVELNLYLDQLISQQADIIKKYSDPTVLDYGSGQSPTVVKRTIQASGGVLPARKDSRIAFLNWEGTPPAINEQYERIRAAIFDISGKPASSFGETVTNQSGVMTNLSLSPTTESAEARQEIWSVCLTEMNEIALKLYEKFAKSESYEISGVRPTGANLSRPIPFSASVNIAAIAGWYENRIKWPSVIVTSDPVYVQNELQKMQSDPPAQSIYTTLENLGIEDVEAELDRIKLQLEDPRFHPDRLKTAMDAASALQGAELGGDMAGLDTSAGLGPAEINSAASASASPHKDQLVNNEY